MKKLMVLAAVAVSAVMAQAAQVSWTSGIVKSPDLTKMAAGLTDGSSYGADGKILSNSSWLGVYGDGTVDYVLTLIYDIGAGEVSHVYEGTLSKAGGTMGNTGKIATTITDDLFDESNRSKTYQYKLVLSMDVEDGKGNAFTLTSDSGLKDATILPSGDIQLETVAPTTWVAAAVPEPTSGLLLLLGVAGLALRRRRA